jgi:transposase
MEIQELVRLLRAGASDRDVVKLLGLNRRTVAKYRAWAQSQGLLEGPLPSGGELERRLAATLPVALPPQQTSTVERYRDEVVAYRARGMEATAIRARLEEAHGHPVSYSAVWRLVRRLAPPETEAFVRVEVPPGSEAQVDFGYAGRHIDPATGELRKSWVFTMVLSWSRHQYAELVFDQRVETWLLCHRHAFEFWGGVPARVVLDNLRAAIVHASVHEPQAQRAYRECAEHYGFLIDPNPRNSPRLKGKVEQGGVHYVCRNFLAGRDPAPVDALNRKLLAWCAETAGQRVHGTTKERPLARFREVERAALLPLPATPYDPAIWKTVTLYRDCYVVFERAYYSAPYRLVGQPLWVRGGARTVEIYTARHELVATHDRATRPGERKTIPEHLPPHKLRGLVASRQVCRAQAAAVGLATAAVVERLLAHRPEDRLKVAQRILGVAAMAGPERLERACARALHYGTPDYPSIKRILAAGLDHASLEPPPAPGPRRLTFARQAGEFVAALVGAVR